MSLATIARDARQIAEAERTLLAARGGKRRIFSITPSRKSSWFARVWSHGSGVAFTVAIALLVVSRGSAWSAYGGYVVWLFALFVNRSDAEEYLEVNDFERLRIPSVGGLLLFRWLVHFSDELIAGAVLGGIAYWYGHAHMSAVQGGALVIATALLFVHVPTFKLWTLGRMSRCESTATRWLTWFGLRAILGAVPTIGLTVLALFPDRAAELSWARYIAPAVIAYFLITTPFLLRSVLLNPPGRRGGVDDDDGSSLVSHRRVVLPASHAGRRPLLSVQWRLQSGRIAWWLGVPYLRFLFPVLLVWAALPGVFAYASVAFGIQAGEVSMFWPLLVVTFAATMLAVEEPALAYLRGVDLRTIRRHNVACSLVSIGLVALCGLCVSFVHDFGAAHLATCGLVGALVLLRCAGKAGVALCFLLWPVGALAYLVTGDSRMPPDVTWCVAAAIAALGLWAMARELGRSEATLRRSMRDEQDDDD